jgi:hypothetical protein
MDQNPLFQDVVFFDEDAAGRYIISNRHASIILYDNSEMKFIGSLSSIAAMLIDFMSMQKQSHCVFMSHNDTIELDFANKNGLKINYIGKHKPDCFDDLVKEINRLNKLKIFW